MTKVLVVEDTDVNRELLTDLLEMRGFEVVTATNGAEALEAVARERPDLVLMDMMMPVMDGFEATRRLKADPATRTIPVVGLTALAMQGDADRVREAGCDDYVTKPLDVTTLADRLRAILAAEGGA